jgi:hypothetical protein
MIWKVSKKKKKNQTETLKTKISLSQIKNTVERHSSTREQVEDRISGLEDKIDIFFVLFCFVYCFIIHMCIQGLGHFSPLPPAPPLPPSPPPPSPPPIPSRNYFALISNFVEERV